MKYIRNIFLLSMLSLSFLMTSCEDDDKNDVVIPAIQVSVQSPADKSDAIGFNPTFTWSSTGDNTNNFKYDFYIGNDIEKLGLRAENIKELKYKITNKTVIKGGVTYYWKVIAKDGIYESESEIWSFATAPSLSPPVLVSPKAFGRDNLKFEWQSELPADGEVLEYKIYLGEENPPTEVIENVKGETFLDYNASSLDEFKTYYWRVEVADSLSSSISEVGSFKKLREGYPDLPSVVTPTNGSLAFARDGDVILDWTDSTDPEGGTVVYDVFLDVANPPVALATSFSGESQFKPTSTLVSNTRYFWKVVAKNSAGNSYSSETVSFDYVGSTGPATPMLAEEVVDGTLGLYEPMVWGNTLGAGTFDVYIDTVNPPLNLVASDVTGTGYVPDTKDIPSDINNVTTYFARVVAKNTDGTAESQVISFTPQITGTYTDVRGSESLDYNWVRIGSQVWMSQNLRTKKLTDGTDLTKVEQPTSANYPITSSSTELYYDEHPVDDGPISGFPHMAPWSDGDNGRVYSNLVPTNPLIAPEGWHVINDTDISTLQAYVPNASNLLDEFYGGTDPLQANFLIAGFRYNDFDGGRPFGFRYGVETSRVSFWTSPSGTNNVWELYPAGNYRYYKQGNPHNRLFGIRLVKD